MTCCSKSKSDGGGEKDGENADAFHVSASKAAGGQVQGLSEHPACDAGGRPGPSRARGGSGRSDTHYSDR